MKSIVFHVIAGAFVATAFVAIPFVVATAFVAGASVVVGHGMTRRHRVKGPHLMCM